MARAARVAPADTAEAKEPSEPPHLNDGFGPSFVLPGVAASSSTLQESNTEDAERITRESAEAFTPRDSVREARSSRFSRRPGFLPSIRRKESAHENKRWSSRRDIKNLSELVAEMREKRDTANKSRPGTADKSRPSTADSRASLPQTPADKADQSSDSDVEKFAVMLSRTGPARDRITESRTRELSQNFAAALRGQKWSDAVIAEDSEEVERALNSFENSLRMSRMRSGLPNAEEPFAGRDTVQIEALPIPVPELHVVIMIVGTHGDVLPFCALGKMMRDKYGHTVRLATHEAHRHLVLDSGLLFYPLGGDPKVLAGWAADFSCRPKHLIKTGMSSETPDKLRMQQEICVSTWGACTMPDPKDTAQRPFRADAIISNPMTYGHIHCAERLKIPLHMMFPQPWTPTHAFAHPFSGLPYKADADWTLINKNSYGLVDDVMWHGMLPIVNSFRTKVLGLSTLRFGAFGGSLLNSCRVPFVKMWSPSFVPKPSDWPEEVDVTGAFFLGGQAKKVDETTPENAALLAWLGAGAPPIFVGFGSMIFDGDKATKMIVAAAQRAGCRVLMQSGWSKLGAGTAGPLPPECFVVGPCPHDWLLPKVAAVVHHGGAGTVAAGLKMGHPTMVCPFFGDQFFWGAMVTRAGVGPKPVPIAQLTEQGLAASFRELREPAIKERAVALAAKIAGEDGVAAGLDAFHRNLPVEDMVCDVLLWQCEPVVARHYYPSLRLKVSDEVHFVVSTKQLMRTRKHTLKRWNVGCLPNPWLGIWSGFFGMVWELLLTVLGLVLFPYYGASKYGVRGFFFGLAKAVVLLLLRPLYAITLFFDRITTGFSNLLGATLAHARGDRFVPKRYIIDPEEWFHLSDDPLRVLKKKGRRAATVNVEKPRQKQIWNSFRDVARLMNVFKQLDRSNDGVLNLADVKRMIDGQREGKLQLPIAEQHLADFLETIDANHDGFITFGEFLLACRRFTFHLQLQQLARPTSLGVSEEYIGRDTSVADDGSRAIPAE